jgi:hypothetical protein
MKGSTRAALSRWPAVVVLAILLLVAGLQAANPHSYVAEAISRIGETGSGAEAALTDLSSVDQLQGAFNHDAGHPRLVLLLSPT